MPSHLLDFSEVGQRSCNLNGILGLHAIGQTKAINRAIQMPGRLLLIPNHQVIQALQTQLDRDDLMIISLDGIFQSQICIIGHLRDIFRLNAIINDLPITL